MSGHSKWHNIQAKKGKADAARGKVFTKLGRELLIAVKEGGPDPAGNSKLKNVIAKCKAANMPNDTINNAIKKASGSNENYEEITYEGYGTSGVAVIVSAATDNKNRTAADVRHAFDKSGGNLGTSGCVSYLFNKKGLIVIDRSTTTLDEDSMMMLALDAGAEDFEASEEVYSKSVRAGHRTYFFDVKLHDLLHTRIIIKTTRINIGYAFAFLQQCSSAYKLNI